MPASYAGVVCASLGIALLMLPGVTWAAVGLELVALAFWLWARSLPDRSEQLARWSWLRRPPSALWLAAALFVALPQLHQVFAPAPLMETPFSPPAEASRVLVRSEERRVGQECSARFCAHRYTQGREDEHTQVH